MSTVQDIHLFNLVDGINSYLKINLTFIQGFEIYFNQILPFLNQEPFLSDMFLPTETVTVNNISYNEDEPILNTNLYYFIGLIKTELNSFKSVCISSFQSLLGEHKKTISNYSFINSFITSQERFYKNLSNFFNLFSFFQTMSSIPNFYNTNEVISSDLITLFSNGKIKRLDLTELYKFNLRNMNPSSRKIFQNQMIHLYEQLQTSSIIIGNIYRKHNTNTEVIQTILSQFQTFSSFFTILFEKVVFYNQEWNNWSREVYELENIDYTQRKIEGSWNDFLSNLSSSNFITSITIDNGGDRNRVGDILTLSTNSNTWNGTAIVTSTLDGVIESIGTITSGGQDFQVGDTLTLSNTTGLYADIEVNTVTNGFINGVSISNRGSGFIVGDSTTTSSSTGTGMTISIDTVRGDLDTITLSSNGSNYQVGDTLTISNTSGFTNSNSTNAELTINSLQNASVNSISITDGGDNYQVGDTITFTNDSITDIETSVTSIIMNTVEISQITIINKGNNNYPLSENINISIGNLSNIISASISEISNITFTTSNISIIDTSTSDYQLDEVFNISYGGITGITATISAITTTLTTEDFQVSGGSGFQLGETIDFTYGGLSGQSAITSIETTISATNLSIQDGGSEYTLGSNFPITYGNIGTISTTINEISNITFTTSNISIIDTSTSDYQLDEVFNISYGGITGITATISAITTTLTTEDFQVSGGSGFQLGETIDFTYGGLSGQSTITSIEISVSENNIQMDDGGSEFSVNDTISFSYGSNISGTITVDSIDESSGEILTFSVSFTLNTGTISNTDTEDFTNNNGATFSFINITGSIQSISNSINDSSGIITSTQEHTYSASSITSNISYSTITKTTFEGNLYDYTITNQGTGILSSTDISYSMNGRTLPTNIINISGVTGSIHSLSLSDQTFTVLSTSNQTLSYSGNSIIVLQNITGSIQSISNSINDSSGIITSTQEHTYSASSITSNISYSTITKTTFEGNLYDYTITNQGSGTLSSTDISYSMDGRTLPTNIINISGVTGDVESISINTSGTGTLTSTQTIDIDSTNGTGLSITISDIDGEVNGLTIGSQTSGNYSGDDISIVSSNTNGSGIQVSMDVYGSINGFSITNDGFGFMTTDTLSITGNAEISSFTIKNGQIYGVSIITGGENYSIGDTITILKSGVTSATLDVTSIMDGILKTVTINDGGQNYTEGGTITVSSGNSTSNAVLPVSTVQNGFITELYITNRGKGFGVGDSLIVTSSNTDSDLEVPTLSVNTIQENSLLSITEEFNSNLSV